MLDPKIVLKGQESRPTVCLKIGPRVLGKNPAHYSFKGMSTLCVYMTISQDKKRNVSLSLAEREMLPLCYLFGHVAAELITVKLYYMTR